MYRQGCNNKEIGFSEKEVNGHITILWILEQLITEKQYEIYLFSLLMEYQVSYYLETV